MLVIAARALLFALRMAAASPSVVDCVLFMPSTLSDDGRADNDAGINDGYLLASVARPDIDMRGHGFFTAQGARISQDDGGASSLPRAC